MKETRKLMEVLFLPLIYPSVTMQPFFFQILLYSISNWLNVTYCFLKHWASQLMIIKWLDFRPTNNNCIDIYSQYGDITTLKGMSEKYQKFTHDLFDLFILVQWPIDLHHGLTRKSLHIKHKATQEPKLVIPCLILGPMLFIVGLLESPIYVENRAIKGYIVYVI